MWKSSIGASSLSILAELLSRDDIDDLAAEVQYLDFDHPVISRLVYKLRETYPNLSTEPPAYCRVEHTPGGVPWHTDTGTASHMAWCAFSARVLLTEPEKDFTGGAFYFADAPHKPIFGFGELMHFRSDIKHCVSRHNGNRRVLLMFFGEDDG